MRESLNKWIYVYNAIPEEMPPMIDSGIHIKSNTNLKDNACYLNFLQINSTTFAPCLTA